nr:uncharacterized protein LOC100187223 isoform X1 [Ciona intestinalis]|eukprot:XP_026691233.1 uncharacterized protein LOC100187223 isoform X1 [Ciona intestinalis]
MAKQKRHSWALGMEYSMEMAKLSRMSYYGTGIGKGLQVPEWDYKSVGDHKTSGRLFLQKSPRDVFTVDLKREMVENDRRIKTSMQAHRTTLHSDKKNLEQVMRNNTKPYVCYRGNILSRYGEVFNNLPASLSKNHLAESEEMERADPHGGAPMTVVDAETVLSEQYVVCHRCKKTYKESKNTAEACRFHLGPIIGVFGGMCQSCGRLDYTKGCVSGYHTRKPRRQESSQKNNIKKTRPT